MLWQEQDYISFDFSISGPRVKNFVEYKNDDQFEHDVKPYVELALEQALFYRNLRDIKTAKEYIKKFQREYPENTSAMHFDMISILDDEVVLQKIKKTRAFWHAKPSMKKMKKDDLYDAD